MLKQLSIHAQYFLPHHLLAKTMGWLSECRTPWFKNFFIQRFIQRYHVDMREALIENPQSYPTFNHFFIRQLKPVLRPIAVAANSIACPVDGMIAQLGHINKNQLLQAKQFYYDLKTLLGDDTQATQLFADGPFITLYLAPNNYHRVHMPLTGKLHKMIYVPGRLFSVNRMTSELIPNLYARNERLISIFETDAGYMAVILIGAMFVGSIQMAWMEKPIRGREIRKEIFPNHPGLSKGEELGHFKMGSTVIVLCQKNKATWLPSLQANQAIYLGQELGTIL